ncbi:alpha/beta hydrolase [Alteromonas pelagimontana]|uniref:Alpha/beta hydrolase n=1 Tax=Alteromonas pelagimontana TaxID=1858656 RepID=A0A6M4MDS4_9ALTE|nr:alpha/beta hydrolase [Alteromonas pelagimontana]QJR81253.1 alpha/beta hydrolase [Alteromonas pelagimontana]
MTFFSRICFLLGLCCGIGGCAIDVSSSSYIYQTSAPSPLDTTELLQAVNKDEAAVSITTVELTNAQGLTLTGVAVSYPKPVVNIVFYAGNGMTISKASGILHEFGKIPANILWIDYQGMGASAAAPRVLVDNLKADALQVFDYGKEVFPKNIPTIVHGLSMGSLFATYVANKREVDGVVLDSAISSVSDVAQNLVPQWTKVFTNLKISPELAIIDNSEYLARYRGPLLMLVGDRDQMTPISFSRELFRQSASTNKSIYVVLGGKHGKLMRNEAAVIRYQTFIETL